MKRKFSRDQVLQNEPRRLLQQHRILQHQQVCIENLRLIGTRLGQVGQACARRLAHQVGQHPLRHIANVGGPFAQVGVIHLTQRLGIFFRCLVERELGRDQVLPDEPRRLLN